MTIIFTKKTHTYIIGQPKRSSLTQRKKVDSFNYSFLTDLLFSEVDWSVAVEIITECLCGAFKCIEVRDMEVSLDLANEQYSVRFTSVTNLPKLAYAALVKKQGEEIFAEEIDIDEGEFSYEDD